MPSSTLGGPTKQEANLIRGWLFLFLIACVLGVIRLPAERKRKAMVRKAVSALDILYRDLSGNLVSTSKLRESLKVAANSEVVLDGSVFVIAERLKGDSLRNYWES